jgi:uncharacterized damage-inducible protein DinB
MTSSHRVLPSAVCLSTGRQRECQWADTPVSIRERACRIDFNGAVTLQWEAASMPMNAPLIENEREGLLAFLEHQREAVRNATYGLREDQARSQPTPSALSLGGLVKHLAQGERDWTVHIAGAPPKDGSFEDYTAGFVLSDDETLVGVLEQYQEASTHTDAVVRGVGDLGRRVQLPEAPWFPDPEGCTVRWILLHLVEETARHAGHADIIRESLDGALSGPLMAAAEGWPEAGWIKPWRPQS